MLKIHHIRNATMLIETEDAAILVDPLLAAKGTMPSYTEKLFNPQRNPIVDLPTNTFDLLSKTTHCLITHLHSDHLDQAGEDFLISNKIPILCSIKDADNLKNRGLQMFKTIDYWKKTSIFEGSIEGIPAVHGYGKVAELMGNVMGYMIQLPAQPSIYLSSDTVFTPDVKYVLEHYQPNISVMACGSAQLDEYDPILMTLEDILQFVNYAPEHVIANHLEAVNHCTTSRNRLKAILLQHKLTHKVWIPDDGDSKLF